VLIDPVSNAVTAQTPVPGYPSAVASAPGGVWMADFRQGVLWRYELQTGALQRISSPGEPRDLAVVGDDVYVASDGPELFSGNISRHDSRSGLREEALTLLACAVGSGDGLLWAAGCPFVQRLNTDGGPLKELATVLVPFADPLRDTNNRMQIRELAVGDGSVWVLGDAVDRRLWRLDELTGETRATIDLPFPPRSVAVGEGLVWITDPLDDTVIPVDPEDNTLLAPVPVGRGAAGVAAGAGAVWVVNSIDGTVSRIDPASRRAVSTIDVGGIPHELSVDDRGVWVTTHAR
jgi:DNA-binding beta-propeller fold protein YncE